MYNNDLLFVFQVYAYQNGESYAMGRFLNRVTASNTTGNATITISNMQPQDTGIYKCEVSNFPDPLGQAQVQLIVQGTYIVIIYLNYKSGCRRKGGRTHMGKPFYFSYISI